MTDYQSFEAAVEPMVWGKSTYTILRVPDDVVAALAPAKRVEGEINDHPINLALTKAPVIDGVFLWAGQPLLDRIGLAPGDPVEVRLRPADPNAVEVPTDVVAALRTAGLTADWDALTPGKRRGALHQIETAKRAQTRQARIEKLISSLRVAQ